MLKKLFLLVTALFVSTSLFAIDPVYTGFFSNKGLEGYDAVAYFKVGKAVKGKSEYNYTYKGAEWLFSSEENLEAFKADPAAYAPQYGGYCAWAMGAEGDDAPGDPNIWSIIDGKLYINYNQEIHDKFSKDEQGFIAKGDVNWKDKFGFEELN